MALTTESSVAKFLVWIRVCRPPSRYAHPSSRSSAICCPVSLVMRSSLQVTTSAPESAEAGLGRGAIPVGADYGGRGHTASRCLTGKVPRRGTRAGLSPGRPSPGRGGWVGAVVDGVADAGEQGGLGEGFLQEVDLGGEGAVGIEDGLGVSGHV